MSLREATFECECHTEQIILAQWTDEPEELYISFWYRKGHDPRLNGWRQRLMFAWRSLRKGSPYADEIILSPPDAVRLAAWLNEAAGVSHLGQWTYSASNNMTTAPESRTKEPGE